MCVIVIGNGKAPKDADIRNMWAQNSHGAGIGWNDGKRVHYIKGLMDVNRLLQLIHHGPETTKNQYVIHFRLASIGTKCRELTHPFSIDKNGRNPIAYDGNKSALFHNGHDGDILGKAIDSMVLNRARIPDGEWSDSRATAYLASYNGMNICAHVNGKFAILTPNNVYTFGRFESEDGFLYSNKYWKRDFRNEEIGFNFNQDNKTVSAPRSGNDFTQEYKPKWRNDGYGIYNAEETEGGIDHEDY